MRDLGGIVRDDDLISGAPPSRGCGLSADVISDLGLGWSSGGTRVEASG